MVVSSPSVSTTSQSSLLSHSTSSPAMPNSRQSFSFKLTSSNYLTWSTKFTSILNSYNLNYHVEGTKPAPSPQVFNVETNRVEPNLEFQTLFQRDWMLLSWIFSSLKEVFSIYH
jgi:hypothetical protein